MADPFLLAQGTEPLFFIPKMANHHGLIAGATGTGKTITLRVLAEQFSALGVPVFMSDVKGDLSGIGKPGGGHAKVEERVKTMGLADLPIHRLSRHLLGCLRRSGASRPRHDQ